VGLVPAEIVPIGSGQVADDFDSNGLLGNSDGLIACACQPRFRLFDHRNQVRLPALQLGGKTEAAVAAEGEDFPVVELKRCTARAELAYDQADLIAIRRQRLSNV